MKKILTLFFLCLTITGWTQIPRIMSYQGVLLDNNQTPYTNGTQVELIFNLYEAESGGESKWAETNIVTISNYGVFNVILGEVNPLNVTFDRPYWLEITVDGTVITERTLLTASPYSLGSTLPDTIRVFPNGLIIAADDSVAYFVPIEDALYFGPDSTADGAIKPGVMFKGKTNLEVEWLKDFYKLGLDTIDPSIAADSVFTFGKNDTAAIYGKTDFGIGVKGFSDKYWGVKGRTNASAPFASVYGMAENGIGVKGVSRYSNAIRGVSHSETCPAIWGLSYKWTGIIGTSFKRIGVEGNSMLPINHNFPFIPATGIGIRGNVNAGGIGIQGNVAPVQFIPVMPGGIGIGLQGNTSTPPVGNIFAPGFGVQGNAWGPNEVGVEGNGFQIGVRGFCSLRNPLPGLGPGGIVDDFVPPYGGEFWDNVRVNGTLEIGVVPPGGKLMLTYDPANQGVYWRAFPVGTGEGDDILVGRKAMDDDVVIFEWDEEGKSHHYFKEFFYDGWETEGPVLITKYNGENAFEIKEDGTSHHYFREFFYDGLNAKSKDSIAVSGISLNNHGVYGKTSDADYSAIFGETLVGTGVTGISDDGVGMWAVSKNNTGLIASGEPTAAELKGDVLIEDNGKLYIDNVPSTETKRLMVWDSDKFVKHITLEDLLEGAEFKGPFVITNSQGDTIFVIDEFGNSLHVGDERFEKKIIVTSPDGEGRVEISPFGIKMYYGQEETMILDPFGYSWHKGREYFENGITVTDEITVTDTIPSIEAGIIRAEKIIAKEKDFQIDHPLYPDEMYLNHTSIESDDMKNMYDGTVVLNNEGEAYVLLPEWFQALNNDFRYQLTCIGGYAPVFIASEIANNQFKIAGGNPGMKVSWQVTGIRHDKWALENKRPVEQWKKRTP